MDTGTRFAVAVSMAFAGACAQAPLAPAPSHLRAEDARGEATIPPPVQVAPVLPKPTPALKPEVGSPGTELEFAL